MSRASDDKLLASLGGRVARLDVVERLFAKRSVNPETGCWEWQGRRDRCGYGRITVAHRRYAVHRLSAAVFLGFELASPLQILHGCHNPACFFPEHLRPGTHEENMSDRRRRLGAQQRDGERAELSLLGDALVAGARRSPDASRPRSPERCSA